jgi:hypothetical protein
MAPIISAVGPYFIEPHNMAYFEFRRALAEYPISKKLPADFQLQKLACLPLEHASLIFYSLPQLASPAHDALLSALYTVLKYFMQPTDLSSLMPVKITVEDLGHLLNTLEQLYQIEANFSRSNTKANLTRLHKLADRMIDAWAKNDTVFSIATAIETKIILSQLKELNVVRVSHALKGIFFASNMLAKLDKYIARLDLLLSSQHTSSNQKFNPS